MRVVAGYLAACATVACILILIDLVDEPADLIVHSRATQILINMSLMMIAISLYACIPALLFIGYAEKHRLQLAAYYVLFGTFLFSMLALLLSGNPIRVVTLASGGAAWGLVYWTIAGRYAGQEKIA